MLLRPKSGARRTRLIAPRSHDQLSSEPHQLSSEPHGVCRPSVHTSTSATRREGPHAGVDRACVSRWREKSAIVRRRHLSAAALVAVRCTTSFSNREAGREAPRASFSQAAASAGCEPARSSPRVCVCSTRGELPMCTITAPCLRRTTTKRPRRRRTSARSPR